VWFDESYKNHSVWLKSLPVHCTSTFQSCLKYTETTKNKPQLLLIAIFYSFLLFWSFVKADLKQLSRNQINKYPLKIIVFFQIGKLSNLQGCFKNKPLEQYFSRWPFALSKALHLSIVCTSEMYSTNNGKNVFSEKIG